VTELRSFDRVAAIYDETRGMPPEAVAGVADGLAAIFRDASEAPRVLETGVGTGRMAAPLAERGVRVAGTDIARGMVARIREKSRAVEVVLAEASRPPFGERCFDGALFVHILHLVPDADATLAAVLRLVRPGGVLVFGRDDPFSGRMHEADGIIERTMNEVTGLGIDGWAPHERALRAFERAVDGAGARLERRTLASWTGTLVPRRRIERLANKTYSSSWQVPDEALPEIITRVTPRLEQAFGSLDAEVEVPRSFSAVFGRLPQ
jgi:SAM-dependent methyltransferase